MVRVNSPKGGGRKFTVCGLQFVVKKKNNIF